MQKKNLSPECIRRIRRMTKAILAEPKYYDQNALPSSSDCGATCCAIGWAVWLDVGNAEYKKMVKEASSSYMVRRAIETLHLPSSRSLVSLFGSAYDWPLPFSRQYFDARTAKQRAKVCADRWEHFIATDGME